MKRRLTAFLTAAMFVLLSFASALPVIAGGAETPRYSTPELYCDHDYQAVVSFLEIEDGNGVKNGEKICGRLGTEYDPEDPTTWTAYSEELGYSIGAVFAYDYTQEMRLWMFLVGDIFSAEDDDAVKPVGELDLSGCTALVRVEIVCTLITSIDVSGCRSLSLIYCFNQPLGSLNLEGCTALRDICCADTLLTSLDLADCVSLEWLWCWNTPLEETDLTCCPKLKSVDFSLTCVTELDFSNCPELEEVWCYGTSVSSLDLSDKPYLYYAYIPDNPGLASLDLTGCTALRELYCFSCALTELDLSDCTALELMWAYYNLITDIDLTNNTALYDISLSYNLLTELDLSNLAELHYIDCIRNHLTEIDFTHNPYIWFDHLTAEGGGEIGTNYIDHILVAMAYGTDGNHFVEWRTEDGETITDEYILSSAETEHTSAVAVFEEDGYEVAPVEFNARAVPKHHTVSRSVDDYNEHDYNAVLAFMEIADENGVKNGEKIAERAGKVYDPEDPMTWTGYCEDMGYGVGAVFEEDGYEVAPVEFNARAVPKHHTVSRSVDDYNEHDYNAVLAFMEIADENGVKNGEKIAERAGKAYDPEDPMTWTGYCEDMGYGVGAVFMYNNGGAKRLVAFLLSDLFWTDEDFDTTPCGDIDLSGCTMLYRVETGMTGVTGMNLDGADALTVCYLFESYASEVSLKGCTTLYDLMFDTTDITEIDVTDCVDLECMWFWSTDVEAVDVSNCPLLKTLNCGYTLVSELDVSNNPELEELMCYGTPLSTLIMEGNNALEYLNVQSTELESIDLSGCPLLKKLYTYDANLSELDLSVCPELEYLYCGENRLTELDLSCVPGLVVLSCEYNELTELDLSNNPLLQRVSCFMNRLTDIDFTNNPLFPIESVSCVGCGNVGTGYRDDELAVTAIADEGWHFVEWHTADGEFITDEHLFFLDGTEYTSFVAVFEQGELAAGDADGDGDVDIEDALLVLRHALEVAELSDDAAARCDVNGDGAITLADALLILRYAMGIIDEL